ncbi:MAG: DUF2333 family protein [Reyranellaceae bacterium]
MTFEPEFTPEAAPRLSWWERMRQRLATGGGGSASPARGRTWRRVGWAVLAVLLLYYPVGMAWIHTIDDNPDFQAPQTAPGESRTVAVMAALIDRETNRYRWTPNDPFFVPSWMLDNMPNYQTGMMAAMARLAVELTDHIGRARGTSQADPDLEKAAGNLKYPGHIWIWDPSISIWPTATSEQQYQAGMRSLIAYNKRLGQGQAVFERRADNLQAALERIASDTGSMSATTDQHVAQYAGSLFDLQVDDIFYANKGRLYAYYLILRELGRDYEAVIRERNMATVWNQMVESFRTAALLQPLVVLNGRPDAQLMPNHLTGQGFYLMRARFQLYEVINILLK